MDIFLNSGILAGIAFVVICSVILLAILLSGTSTPLTRYTIVDNLTGKDMIQNVGPNGYFDFFTDDDPTFGFVKYVADKSLLEIVDSTKLKINIARQPNAEVRSIRLIRNSLFDTGLLVFDVEHIPADISSWPAFWTNGLVEPGSGWALNGEIDILEQINNSNFNSCTLHTSASPGVANCSMDPALGFLSNDCFAASGPKTCGKDFNDFCPFNGCSKPMGANTFGSAFNANGGGTVAMELTSTGLITIWMWIRGETVPDFSKVTSSTFEASQTVYFTRCPGSFKKQQVTINTTFCGMWAGEALPGYWNNPAECNDWVRLNSLQDSYWIIRGLQFYKINE